MQNAVGIPLRRGERHVVLQLESLIDDCYRDGRYYRMDSAVLVHCININYRQEIRLRLAS